MKGKKTTPPEKNIYGHHIKQNKKYDGFWADQVLTWRFWRPDWSKSFTMNINIMRTPEQVIRVQTKNNLGLSKKFIFEPSAVSVMDVMRPKAA